MDSMITIHGERLRIHYTLEGKGTPLILLHGWGQNLEMMKFIADYFQRRFQVLNLDLPGFGESEEPYHAWSLDDYVLFIHEICVKENLQNPILVAHSFGARIALLYAHKYQADKLILTGAAGIKKPKTFSYYAKVYSYKLLKKLRMAPHMGSEDYKAASDVMKGVLIQSVERDLSPLLPKITNETLLVWGEKDQATPLWMGETMEKAMPNATLIVLEDEDHFAYFHQPKRFLAILEYFI